MWQDHLFPLPHVEDIPCDSKLGRGTLRRVNGERAVHRRVGDVLRGLNAMSGRRGAPARPGWSSAQLEVRELAEGQVRQRGRPPSHESGEQVLTATTKGRSDYSGTSLGAAVASYRLSELSLPGCVRDAPLLRDLCSDRAKASVDDYTSSMLRPQDEYEALDEKLFVEPYMDPVLRQSRRKYKELLAELDRRGLIYWSATCRERCAVFFVRKKSGKLRLIMDARRANLRFREPPGVSLCSAESLGRMEIDLDDVTTMEPSLHSPPGLGAEGTGAPSMGMVDVQDCFLRMILGGELSEYFALPSVSGSEARAVRATAGRGDELSSKNFGLVPSEDFEGELFPCLRSLPM